MSESSQCPKCGSPIPAEAPHGLCPKCLLAQASIPTEAGKDDATSRTAPTREALAAAFPHLEILELIGQGGMGFVFKARQPKLERLVALKILPPTLASDPAFAERFTREGRALARLNHPNIVTIHDFGQAGPFFYLLMEYVDGVNLRAALRAGKFTPAQALAVVPKICEALQYAHGEGILHRDIKPENILIDKQGRVKIADFGIAKLAGDTLPGARLTASGGTLGTPYYAAPEQIEGPGEVDHRADIFSLGVVFYEMLTGGLPLGKFPLPSSKVQIDVRLDEVVLHALEKEPDRRYQEAGQIKTAMENIAATPGMAPQPAASAKGKNPRLNRGMTLPNPLPNVYQSILFRLPGWAYFVIGVASAIVVWLALSPRGDRLKNAPQSVVVVANPPSPTKQGLTPQPETPSAPTPPSFVMHPVWYQAPPGHAPAMSWTFKAIVPAGDMAQLCVVSWTNGIPQIVAAAYVKVGEKPAVLDDIAVSRNPVRSNGVQWSFNSGFGATGESWATNLPPMTKLPLPPGNWALQPGRQLIVPLAEYTNSVDNTAGQRQGIELRVLLSTLNGPAVQTLPDEYDRTNFIGGFGFAESKEAALREIREMPAKLIATDASKAALAGAPAIVMDVGPARQIPWNQTNIASWGFRSLVSSGYLAEFCLVSWSNETPQILSAYYIKGGNAPAILNGPLISVFPPKISQGVSKTRWQFGTGPIGGREVAAANFPPFLWPLETPAAGQLSLYPGSQLVVPLVQSTNRLRNPSGAWEGVELRVLASFLQGPAVLTSPDEYDCTNFIGGYGFASSKEDVVKAILEWPVADGTKRGAARAPSAKLNADLRAAQADLAAARDIYGPNNSEIRVKEAKVAELQRMAREEPDISDDLLEAKIAFMEATNIYAPNSAEYRSKAARVQALEQASGYDGPARKNSP